MTLLDARRLRLIDGGRGFLQTRDSMGSVRMQTMGKPFLWSDPIDLRPVLDLRACAYPKETRWS